MIQISSFLQNETASNGHVRVLSWHQIGAVLSTFGRGFDSRHSLRNGTRLTYFLVRQPFWCWVHIDHPIKTPGNHSSVEIQSTLRLHRWVLYGYQLASLVEGAVFNWAVVCGFECCSSRDDATGFDGVFMAICPRSSILPGAKGASR
jgi:hypothetical protein